MGKILDLFKSHNLLFDADDPAFTFRALFKEAGIRYDPYLKSEILALYSEQLTYAAACEALEEDAEHIYKHHMEIMQENDIYKVRGLHALDNSDFVWYVEEEFDHKPSVDEIKKLIKETVLKGKDEPDVIGMMIEYLRLYGDPVDDY